jgi:hypothetical protein
MGRVLLDLIAARNSSVLCPWRKVLSTVFAAIPPFSACIIVMVSLALSIAGFE